MPPRFRTRPSYRFLAAVLAETADGWIAALAWSRGMPARVKQRQQEQAEAAREIARAAEQDEGEK